mmetsp:Transcript_84199/g.234839  ORF Transcript_84199/g.234839 Transcript_84199/m.234839 type:complete len:373 (+) Transcript_84199:110-1228(+)
MCAATLKHLQALQVARPLDVPPSCLGVTEGLQLEPKKLFEDTDDADSSQLHEKVRLAEFWISLLEGEKQDLAEEVAKQKQRHQLASRQVEAKASALREAEVERKRLQAEIKWLQQSRDDAIRDRHLGRQDASKAKDDADSKASRAGVLEDELRRERDEKAELEAKLVKTKVRYAEALQRVDSLEVMIEYYEDQLRAANPAFEPVDLSTLGQWVPRPADLELESNNSGATEQPSPAVAEQPPTEEHRKSVDEGQKGFSLKDGIHKIHKISKMRKIFGGGRHKREREDPEQQVTPQASPRDVTVEQQQHQPSPSSLSVNDAEGGSGDNGGGGAPHGGLAPSSEASGAAVVSPTPSPEASAASARPRKRWEMRVE